MQPLEQSSSWGICDGAIVADMHLSKEEIRVIPQCGMFGLTKLYPVIIWQMLIVPLLWMQTSCAGCSTGCWWLSLVGYMPTCGEHNLSPKRLCSPTVLAVSFLQDELFLLRDFVATCLPSWQSFRGLVSTGPPSKRVRGQRCGNGKSRLGKRLCRVWEVTRSEAERAGVPCLKASYYCFWWFLVGAASSMLCAVREFSYKGGHWGRVGHCSKKACESEGIVFYLS